MVEYETFEDWFEELEGFSFRSERFFQHLELAKTQHERNEFCEKWLRVAFEMGQQSQETAMSGFQSKKEMANSRWLINLEQDGEDLILPLNEEILEQTGWKTGDELLWETKAENVWTLRKKP